jgi:hypothetical protein
MNRKIQANIKKRQTINAEREAAVAELRAVEAAKPRPKQVVFQSDGDVEIALS